MVTNRCGVTFWNHGLKRERSVARVAELATQDGEGAVKGCLATAHTSRVSTRRTSHSEGRPYFAVDTIAVAHNGIIEKYEDIHEELIVRDVGFSGQTNTEVLSDC